MSLRDGNTRMKAPRVGRGVLPLVQQLGCTTKQGAPPVRTRSAVLDAGGATRAFAAAAHAASTRGTADWCRRRAATTAVCGRRKTDAAASFLEPGPLRVPCPVTDSRRQHSYASPRTRRR